MTPAEISKEEKLTVKRSYDALGELETLKSVKENLKCNFCNYKTENQAHLKQHTRSNHSKDKSNQTIIESSRSSDFKKKVNPA